MKYELYTFPACEKCMKAKRLLEERGVDYIELNPAVTGKGKEQFVDLMKKYKKEIKREDGRWLILPLIVIKNEQSEKDLRIIQGLDGLVNFLEEKKFSL